MIAEIDIDAPARVVWSLISDISVATRFSTESHSAEWQGDAQGLGARFIGRNRHDAVGEWALPCTIDVFDEAVAFGWRTSDPASPGGRWRFDLESAPGRTRLRFSFTIDPGLSGTSAAIEANPGKEARVLRRRLDEVQANMQRTVECIQELAQLAR